MKFNKRVLKTATLAFSTLALSVSALADVKIVDKPYFKAVGNVAWHTQADISPKDVINRKIPKNMTSLVFMRRQDNDPIQTSANIAINDRFQVSLQPNGYTQVYSCAGVNFISAEKTGLKTNDLLKDAKSFNLAPNGTYYFYVDVNDKTGQSNVIQVTKDSADKILVNKKYQTHQISRVVPNCPTVKKVAKPVVVPPPKLLHEVKIEVEVLFDTDKHFIKPQFEKEVAKVAEFMTAYPNTTAVIEGHTDSRAPTDYNQKLSERRAGAVKRMLVQKFGINPKRLSSIGYGELRPRATNKTKAGMQLNRRVIAVINERVIVDEKGRQVGTSR
ncbi:MAG: OmpA family protein [Moraxellaceae bacterium]|nr:OmpA family protein [Moraxellaceae bacterium]